MVLTRLKRKKIDERPVPSKYMKLELNASASRGKNVLKKSDSEVILPKNAQSTIFTIDIKRVDEAMPKLQTQTQPTELSGVRASVSMPELQTQTQSASLSDARVVMLRKVRKVLNKNFKNAQERLALDTTPQCLYDLRNCVEHHTSDVTAGKTSQNSVYLAKTYLNEGRHFQFFQYVRHMQIGLKEFPGEEICNKILKQILVSRHLYYQHHDDNTLLLLLEIHIRRIRSAFARVHPRRAPLTFRNNHSFIPAMPISLRVQQHTARSIPNRGQR
jgi:hypothetical protein